METYTLTEAAKRVLIPKSFKGKGVKILTGMLEACGVIEKGYAFDHKQAKAWVLTDYIKRTHPEVFNYFEEITTRDGWYQLRVTEYGIQNIWYFICELENEEMEER